MGAITTIKYKKNGKEYTKYVTTLPKDKMDLVQPQRGDLMIFVSETAGIYSFKFERKKNVEEKRSN